MQERLQTALVKPVHNVANAVCLLVRLQYLIVAPDFENHDVVEAVAFVVHFLLVRARHCALKTNLHLDCPIFTSVALKHARLMHLGSRLLPHTAVRYTYTGIA